MKKILVINPGSTSTKVAFFEDGERIYDETIDHDKNEIRRFSRVADQLEYRYGIIAHRLKEKKIDLREIDAVAARGGLLRPIEGGIYKISENMINDLISAKYGEHASNLGAPLALKFAEENHGILCITSDPTCVDELDDFARITGAPFINNISKFHALNQKYVAGRAARDIGRSYQECNFIVAHLGGGISVGVHHRGRVVYVNNCLDGTGPFSPERAGTIPRLQLIEECYSGKYTENELKSLLNSDSGLFGYLGSNDLRKIEDDANRGKKENKFYIEAMCYQIAREIGAGSTVLKGDCHGIILTGGMAYSEMVVGFIKERVSHIAKVMVYPGSDENRALAEAALKAFNQSDCIKIY